MILKILAGKIVGKHCNCETVVIKVLKLVTIFFDKMPVLYKLSELSVLSALSVLCALSALVLNILPPDGAT